MSESNLASLNIEGAPIEQELSPREAIKNPYVTKKGKYYALGLLTVIYSFNFIDRQLLAILQETIKIDLGLSDSQLGLLTGFAFAVFYVTAGIPIARWADRSNRRNIISMSVFLWSLMTAVSGFAQNYIQLLIARVGVGVGEAGGSPPSHSIISDIFPPQSRASALGFYSTGVNIGILFGFLLGGWLNEFFGWRVAFIVVGAPGILLAIVVRMTLAEPIRGLSENRQVEEDSPSFSQVLSLLWSRLSFRHLALAVALNAFVSYSVSSWSASFMIRSHGMSTGELGTWLALIMGFGGLLSLNLDASYVLEYDVGAFQGKEGFDAVGSLNSASFVRPIQDLKANFSVNYQRENHNLRLVTSYIADYVDNATDVLNGTSFEDTIYNTTVDSHTTYDLFYTMAFNEGSSSFSVSAINLTDEAAPYVRADLRYDAQTHNAFGRMLKVGFTHNF